MHKPGSKGWGKTNVIRQLSIPLPRKGPMSSLVASRAACQGGSPTHIRSLPGHPLARAPGLGPTPPPSSSLPRGRGWGLSTPRAAWDRAWPPVVKSSDSDGLGSMSWGGGGREPISCPSATLPSHRRWRAAPGSPQTTDGPRPSRDPRADGETEAGGGGVEGRREHPGPRNQPSIPGWESGLAWHFQSPPACPLCCALLPGRARLGRALAGGAGVTVRADPTGLRQHLLQNPGTC